MDLVLANRINHRYRVSNTLYVVMKCATDDVKEEDGVAGYHYQVIGGGLVPNFVCLEAGRTFKVPIKYQLGDQKNVCVIELSIDGFYSSRDEVERNLRGVLRMEKGLKPMRELYKGLAQEGSRFYLDRDSIPLSGGLEKWRTETKLFVGRNLPAWMSLVPLMHSVPSARWALAFYKLAEIALLTSGLQVTKQHNPILDPNSTDVYELINDMAVFWALSPAYRNDKRPRISGQTERASASMESLSQDPQAWEAKESGDEVQVLLGENTDQWENPLVFKNSMALSALDCEDGAQLIFQTLTMLQKMPPSWVVPSDEPGASDEVKAAHIFARAAQNAEEKIWTHEARIVQSLNKVREVMSGYCVCLAVGTLGMGAYFIEDGGDGILHRNRTLKASYHVYTMAIDRNLMRLLLMRSKKEQVAFLQHRGEAFRPTLIFESTAWTMSCKDVKDKSFGSSLDKHRATLFEAIHINSPSLRFRVPSEVVEKGGQYRETMALYCSWSDCNELEQPGCWGELACVCSEDGRKVGWSTEAFRDLFKVPHQYQRKDAASMFYGLVPVHTSRPRTAEGQQLVRAAAACIPTCVTPPLVDVIAGDECSEEVESEPGTISAIMRLRTAWDVEHEFQKASSQHCRVHKIIDVSPFVGIPMIIYRVGLNAPGHTPLAAHGIVSKHLTTRQHYKDDHHHIGRSVPGLLSDEVDRQHLVSRETLQREIAQHLSAEQM